MFADRYRLKRNWLKGFCTVRTFEGHSQGKDDKTTNFYLLFTLLSLTLFVCLSICMLVCLSHIPTGISCVQFDDTRIVSGSWDKTIKVGATYFWQR